MTAVAGAGEGGVQLEQSAGRSADHVQQRSHALHRILGLRGNGGDSAVALLLPRYP